ncbi:hotdog family protein [Actinokineospora bangkokensis]|uniref:ApeI dehydratase-like domain-containing protein n=1 Tax=Actinokineospora bangkokensis TaxID=1193682 RepID=A0A1Q9LIX4_9PSEU|nr:hypothetical protein [Actinokineospora bangkokensis]OLR91929.1 hypothetical protein BJP25_24180 [Actinokineospora bangkokensis]
MSTTAPPGLVVPLTADPADPVFTGHYPGFPILPGLFLVQHVHRAATAHPAVAGLRLVELERVRFRRPVYPGDTAEAALVFEAAGGGDLVCTAEVAVRGQRVAGIRLRYGNGGTT